MVSSERVMQRTGCGTKPLARVVAKMKLRALVDSAKIVRKELGK